MILDEIITVDSQIDLMKMESVRNHHRAALNAVVSAPEFDNKDKAVAAMKYSLEYIGRCQATFKTIWDELFAAQKVLEGMKAKEIESKARIAQLKEDLKDVKTLFQR